MRIDQLVLAFAFMGSAAASVIDSDKIVRADVETPIELYKRRGGGGGGGRGGGGGSGGSKGSGSGSSGSGGSKGSGSGSSSSGGVKPTYGGGKYYGGGSASTYRSGGRSPGGLLPFVFVGGAIAFWPGVWLYGANVYPYGHYRDDDDADDYYVYKFHNETTDEDEERKVLCACSRYADSCGCDENDDTEDYLDELIGDGDYDKLNKTLVNVGKKDGDDYIFINGTLPNGTTVDDQDNGASGNSMRSMVEALGLWPAIAAVTAAVFLA